MEVLYRDWALMTALTIGLLVMSFGFTGKSRTIGRPDGLILLLVYVGYASYLVASTFAS
jgi:cation:H+ antiporter